MIEKKEMKDVQQTISEMELNVLSGKSNSSFNDYVDGLFKLGQNIQNNTDKLKDDALDATDPIVKASLLGAHDRTVRTLERQIFLNIYSVGFEIAKLPNKLTKG